jgi:hypothetical protein
MGEGFGFLCAQAVPNLFFGRKTVFFSKIQMKFVK